MMKVFAKAHNHCTTFINPILSDEYTVMPTIQAKRTGNTQPHRSFDGKPRRLAPL
jgi:hypothetical protein